VSVIHPRQACGMPPSSRSCMRAVSTVLKLCYTRDCEKPQRKETFMRKWKPPTLSIRMNPEDKDALRTVARRMGVSMSEAIRRMVRERLDQIKQNPPDGADYAGANNTMDKGVHYDCTRKL
jgi:hypothetical protein